jgi:hypothetical protein
VLSNRLQLTACSLFRYIKSYFLYGNYDTKDGTCEVVESLKKIIIVAMNEETKLFIIEQNAEMKRHIAAEIGTESRTTRLFVKEFVIEFVTEFVREENKHMRNFVVEQIDNLARMVQNNFQAVQDEMNERFNEVDVRFSEVDRRFDIIENIYLHNQQNQIDALRDGMTVVKKHLNIQTS